jgi:hypothetical protein
MDTTSPAATSVARLIAEQHLDRPVLDWLAEQRAANRSFRLIARDLFDLTAGQVDVTGETIRLWAKDMAA